MRPSLAIWLVAALLGVLAGGALALFLPELAWWIDAIVALIAAGAAYQTLLRIEADRSLVDRR